MLSKNDIVTVTIEDMSTEGEGIGKVDGFPLFIKDTVIGDVAQVKVIKCKKNYGYGRLEKLLAPSDKRCEASCSVARACGGCQLQALKYGEQLAFKRKKVLMNLRKLGGLDAAYSEEAVKGQIPVEPIIGGERTLRYRNKALVPVGMDKEGNVVAGFYAGRTHSIIPMEDCLLTPEEYAPVIRTVIQWMKKNHITAYSEQTHQGLVRHVLIRKAFATGELMVCVVINGTGLSKKSGEALVTELLNTNENICSISCNTNTEVTNVIMGRKMTLLYGAPKITDRIGDISYGISPLSFYQVNPEQTKKLYDKVLEFAGLTGHEVVWDLYCGIGTIALYMARSAKYVYGVEIVPDAIADAKENAARNNIVNTEFFVGKAEEVFPACYHEDPARYRADVIVVDPPRKGCDEALLRTILAMEPKRLVYVSCDSATLARDLKWLMEHGDSRYQIERVVPCDQFGMTVHVESCVLLTRMSNRKPDARVRIDVDLEDYYRIKANKSEKPSYF